jgi:hypothetical protein
MNSQDVTEQLYNRIITTDEPIVLVLAIHIYTEYWIDKIIQSKSPTSKEILDNNNYTFSIKLHIVYNMGLIPEGLYRNIKKLNSLRNKYAHELNYDFSKADLYYDLSGIRIMQKDGEMRFNSGDISSISNFKTDKEKLIAISMATYGWINYHAKNALGIS